MSKYLSNIPLIASLLTIIIITASGGYSVNRNEGEIRGALETFVVALNNTKVVHYWATVDPPIPLLSWLTKKKIPIWDFENGGGIGRRRSTEGWYWGGGCICVYSALVPLLNLIYQSGSTNCNINRSVQRDKERLRGWRTCWQQQKKMLLSWEYGPQR